MKTKSEISFKALNQADERRLAVSSLLDSNRRGELGQFMTPAPIATFMSSLFERIPENIELLDAGAGVGSLSASFVHEVCQNHKEVKSINITVFEIDPLFQLHLKETLEACKDECNRSGIQLSYNLITEDFIQEANSPLLSKNCLPDQYDCAILNPPYAKINSKSKTRRALRTMGIETTNLYTAFVAVALLQLKDKGELVAITPRSFCNGTYFEPFRHFMLDRAALKKVHVYDSRKHAFKDDEVLQENIIFQLVKGEKQPETLTLSSSHSPLDLNRQVREISFSEVILPNDSHRFIRLVMSEEDESLAQRVRSLPCSLADLGIQVSTGRVVDFRAKDHLRKDPGEGTVPLIYPGHFEDGYVKWPKSESKKPNALASNEQTEDLMVEEGIYVLTKRFSAKEEKRRLVSAIYDPSRIASEQVGFENHLNYFHSFGKGLSLNLAKGLALFLNSTAADQYFRQFSGHTQVNATDLRSLPYPSTESLENVGDRIGNTFPPQHLVDEIIGELL